MKVAVVGGGPAGLYFALLFKKAFPEREVVVFERNPVGATYGWGVVFSDRTLTSFREADYRTYKEIIDRLIVWDAIDVRYRDELIRCGGQAFSGIARKALLETLYRRGEGLGVQMEFEHAVTMRDVAGFDLVVAADGIRSEVRETRSDVFRPRVALGRSRYIWFGTTRAFDSFTFIFRANDHGFFQVHAYPYDGAASTFIVECPEEAWRAAGLDRADDAAAIAYCEELFAPELRGHPLMSNNSKWLQFATLANKRWQHENVVLVGDAAHTAHFSIGSGTKLAMEDSIALANSLEAHTDLRAALVDYELERKPRVQRFQEAARQSQTYFENARRYAHMEPLQFAFHLLSRSGRIDYDDLRVRDPHLVASVDRWFARHAEDGARSTEGVRFAAPPAFAPLRLAGITFPNRTVVRASGPDRLKAAAETGAALVMTTTVAVSDHGRITPEDEVLATTADAQRWRDALDAARGTTGCAFAVTLGHSGPRGATQVRRLGADLPLEGGEGWTPLAASPMRYTPRSPEAAEIDAHRMNEVRDDFVTAARRANDAGFDMLELHMGHGYLLATFISPLTNRRSDGYGGSIDNRLRYPLEVLDAVRAIWPSHKPVGVAFSASDWARGGLGPEEALAVARDCRGHGVDVIRVLAGQTTARFKPQLDPYFLASYADRIRNELRVATVATGDITTIDHVNTLVAGGRADLCQLRQAFA